MRQTTRQEAWEELEGRVFDTLEALEEIEPQAIELVDMLEDTRAYGKTAKGFSLIREALEEVLDSRELRETAGMTKEEAEQYYYGA